ncbi:MAG: hypothetical protein HKN79_04195, partial [Flavobacteriales bacterium]|nr:hypothetical protein [Flavobacteriales bacterium]
MELTLKKLIPLIALVMCTVQGDAQRFAGANLAYECVSDTEYLIRLKIFYNCAISNPSTLESVRVIKSPFNPEVVNLTRVGLEEVSQICPAQLDQSMCNGGGVQGFYKLTYEGTLTHDGSHEFIRLRWKVGYRIESINLDNTSAVDQYAHAVIYPQAAPCNTSPQSSVESIPTFCTNEDVNYNLALYDPDQDDSLQFSFTDALVPNGAWDFMPATYEVGYAGDPPITGATIDPNTGNISFNTPDPGIYTIAVKVDEYDTSGTLIGEQVFDQIFYIQNCSDAPPSSLDPHFTLESGTATLLSDDSLKMCYGDDFCVSYDFTSPNAGAELSVHTNIDEVIPGASVNVTGTNPVHVEICWTANPNYSQGPVSIVVTDDACDFSGIAQETFFFKIIPGVYAGEDIYFCAGQEVQLQAEGSDNYSWSGISGDPVSLFNCTDCPDPVFTPTQESVFEVQGTNAGNGCSTTDQVAVLPSLDYSMDVVDTGCDGDDGEIHLQILTGSGDYSVDLNGTIISLEGSTFDTTGLAIGTYDVVLIDDEVSCQNALEVDIVMGAEIPQPAIAAATTVCGSSLTLDGSIDNSLIQWSASGPGAIGFDDSEIEDPTVTVTTAGIYWFFIEETHDVSGCIGLDSIEVTFLDPAPVYAGVDTTVCAFEYQMPATASNGTWEWFPLGPGAVSFSTSSADPSALVTVSVLGSYDFLWNFSGDNGCDSSGTVTIQFLSTPVAQSPDTLTFCDLEDNFLSATPAGPGESGTWDILSGSFLYNSVVADSPIDNLSGYGEYLAVWTVSNGGCSTSDTTLLRYLEPETAQIDGFDIQVCGSSHMISANNDEGQWSTSDPALVIVSADSPSTELNATEAGSYVISWTVGEGICADTDSRTIVFYDSAIVDIQLVPEEICSNEEITLFGMVQNAISYQWSSNGDGSFDDINALNTTYQPGVNDSINGGVTITLTADGESVCPVIETSVFVEIIGLPE